MAVTYNPEKDIYTSDTGQTFKTHDEAAGAVASSFGQTYTPGQSSPITAKMLAPTTSPNLQTPQFAPTTAPNMDTTTAYPNTPQESEISGIIRGAVSEGEAIAGEKAAYTVEQEKAAQLEPLRKAEADYTARYNQLAADYKNVENKMQLAAEGRGITAGGLAPITASEQRKLSIEANTVGALLAATQGRISFAQAQVDRAVNQKFAQREAVRNAKLANLDLLLKDPTLTNAQKARADAQAAKLKKEEEGDVQRKQDAKTIMSWATELATNPLIAQQIMDIGTSDNPDIEKAFALYSANKPTVGGYETPTIKSINGVDMQWNPTTGQWEQPTGVVGGVGGVVSPYKSEIATTGRQAVSGLIKIAQTNPGIFGRTASLPIPNFLRSDAYRNYSAQLDYLKGNIIPAALSAMRDASKTGGALGQVSDREGAWLGSSLGALNMNQSKESIINQLIEIDRHLATWQNAVQQYGGVGGTSIVAPTGEEIILSD